ncbi:uncharacterized protein LOC114523227 isoform X2 [Dendronephthya gigantea]|uniref:uncharacterized protein LOC114523227 isoform X2 n=1 Tax=Dendronephthya gigantea TaxID=151771 RepID=UPI00106D3788|nr:uncharacterized protein LOC114523227 isoform X2 [Dendronephthya gigantea]
MKKSGLKNPNKPDKFNATDISLVIILAFCSLVILFIGYHCCQRKRSKGKNKAAKRRIRNKGDHQENGDLLGGSFQASDDSLDESQNSNASGQEPHRDEEIENQGPDNYPTRPSFLSRIMMHRSLPTSSFISRDKDRTSGSKSLDHASLSKVDPKKQDSRVSKQTRSKCKTSDANNKKSAHSEEKEEKFRSSKWYVPKLIMNRKESGRKSDGKSGNTTNEKGKGKKNGKQSAEKINNEGNTGSRDTKQVEQSFGEIPSLDHVTVNEDRTGVIYKKNYSKTEAEDEIRMETKVGNVEQAVADAMIEDAMIEDAMIEDAMIEDAMIEDAMIEDAMIEDTSLNVATKHKNGKTDENIYENVPKDSMHEIEPKIEKTSVDSYQNPPSPKDDIRGDLFAMDDDTMDDTLDNLPREKPSLGLPRHRLESIGEVYNVVQYARNEWKSETDKAIAIREGYFQIPQLLGLNNLRVIRGDNYCAIRAALFQALAKKIPILSKLGRIQELPQELAKDGFGWIDRWNFASRLPVRRDQVRDELKACLTELYDLVQLNAQMENEEGRVAHLLANFNYKPVEFEVRILEAVKFLMLDTAIKLHTRSKADEDVPLFAIIMFARDTSMNPRDFMAKHLNAVGNTGGLEQVEMHLLGYTLGVTIKVVRPSHYGQSDFIASYPEDMPDRTPVVTMVAEDDRHYNILS